MPREITITIPDDLAHLRTVDQIIDEFHRELGHVCDGTDEWTDTEVD